MKRTPIRVVLRKGLKDDCFSATSDAFSRPIIIGRDRSCDWCVAGLDRSVSARHAELSWRRGAFVIRDLGSRNGVLVAGERVTERRLRPGDIAHVGECEIAVLRPDRTNASGRAPEHRIEQINGPDAGRSFELVPGPGLVVGSDPACDIVCASPFVSRRHARFFIDDKGDARVENLGARNGTFYDRQPLTRKQMLKDGAVVSIAQIDFRFLDKNDPHVRAQFGRKILAAVATLVLALAARQAWLAARPDAGRLISRARQAAANEDFKTAFALAERAADARRSDMYAVSRIALVDDLRRWTNTIARWRTTRQLLGLSQWGDALDTRSNDADWGWNTRYAAIAHEEERRAFDLLDAFNGPHAGRNLLPPDALPSDVTTDPNARANFLAALETSRSRLDAALGAATNTMANDKANAGLDAALAALIPAETNATAPADYLEPLVSAATGVSIALNHAIASNAAFDSHLAALAMPDPLVASPDGAARLLKDLEVLAGEDDGERERQRDLQKKGRYRVLRHSGLLALRYADATNTVAALAAAETTFAANLRAVAHDDARAFLATLPLPSPKDCGDVSPSLRDYRNDLEARQKDLAILHEDAASRFSTLRRWGLDPLNPALPDDLVRLFSRPLPPAPLLRTALPPQNADAPADDFDSVFGARDIRTFLDAIRSNAGLDAPRTAYVQGHGSTIAWEGNPRMPLLRIAANRLQAIKSAASLIDTRPAADPHGIRNLVANADAGSGNLFLGLRRLANAVNERADQWRQTMLEPVAAASGPDAILARAACLLLFPPAKQTARADAARDFAERIAAERRAEAAAAEVAP